MDNATRDKLIKTCEKNDVEYTTYDGYSGRGMYGATTDALVVMNTVDMGFIVKKAQRRGVTLRSDNLGLQYIVY